MNKFDLDNFPSIESLKFITNLQEQQLLETVIDLLVEAKITTQEEVNTRLLKRMKEAEEKMKEIEEQMQKELKQQAYDHQTHILASEPDSKWGKA